MAKSMKLGGGGRFMAGVKKIESKGEPASEAKAVMAIAGRKKYGAKKMAGMAKKGKTREMKGNKKSMDMPRSSW